MEIYILFDSLRKTQLIASKTKGSSFLIAPTGSGKTEASFYGRIIIRLIIFLKGFFMFCRLLQA